MIRFARAFKSLDSRNRQQLLQEPWGFAEWFDRIEGATSRQLRHMLLHLLFPDDFERVSSRSDKKKIEKAFTGLLNRADLDQRDRSPTPVGRDRRLWHIRRALMSQRPGETLDYYSTPELRQRWRPDEKDADDAPPRVTEAAADAYAHDASTQRVWVIGAGVNAEQWPVFSEQDIVGIGWGEIGVFASTPTATRSKPRSAKHTIRTAIPRMTHSRASNSVVKCALAMKSSRSADRNAYSAAALFAATMNM